MKLNDKAVYSAKPATKDYKLADGGGLYLLVKVSGSKLWRMKYRFAGKEKLLSFGNYPATTLKDARDFALQAKKMLLQDVDPMAVKKDVKAEQIIKAEEIQKNADTVELVSLEFIEKFSKSREWSDRYTAKILSQFKRDLFPQIGSLPIADIKPAQLLACLRKVESRGTLETAHKIHQNCGQVWRYAVATGRAERDITSDLKGAIAPAKETHLAAVTEPQAIGDLLRAIDGYVGFESVRFALRLSPYLFVRPSELRLARWQEFDFDTSVWTIPGERMKRKITLCVPLSKQVIGILNEMKKSSSSEFLFPSPRSNNKAISDMAVLNGLRRMGYTGEEMTAHGFRALASTNLEELGYDSRLIEIQLAHSDKDAVRAAYKRNTHLIRLNERKEMMQCWADYLDKLRAGAEIIPLQKLA